MSRKPILVPSAAFAFSVITLGIRAQDISNTTVQHGPSEYETLGRKGQVVYVSGNDVVITMEDDSQRSSSV